MEICACIISYPCMFSAEMIGFKNLDPYYGTINGTYTSYIIPGIQFFTNNSKLDLISNIQRGQHMYTGALTHDHTPGTYYEPVPMEFYVQFSFLSYFIAFIGILLIQSFTIFITDTFWLKNMSPKLTLWKRIIHAMQKSHLPFSYQNWHEGNGSCLDHMKRKKLVQKEVLMSTIINLAFNMVMLIPLVILCKIRIILTHFIYVISQTIFFFRSRNISEA